MSTGRPPEWLIVVYAAVGALFMPFLAAALLFMNNRQSLAGDQKNGFFANAALVLVLCAYLAAGRILS